MKLSAVMQEVADRLDGWAGLRGYGYPPKAVQPLAAIVGYPDSIDEQSYGRGLDRMTLPLWITAGDVNAQSTRDTLSDFVDGSGDKSIKERLEGGQYSAFHTIDARPTGFEPYQSGSVEYLAARFDVEITGSGT